MRIKVTWCKWSIAVGYYCLHSKTFKNLEKAKKYEQKITKNHRKFIWSYEIDGKEVDKL